MGVPVPLPPQQQPLHKNQPLAHLIRNFQLKNIVFAINFLGEKGPCIAGDGDIPSRVFMVCIFKWS